MTSAVQIQEEKPKKPRMCWRIDRWCSDYCVAYRDGECVVLELLKGLHDRLSDLESALTDLTEAIMKK